MRRFRLRNVRDTRLAAQLGDEGGAHYAAEGPKRSGCSGSHNRCTRTKDA
jgi:hypothetical protein